MSSVRPQMFQYELPTESLSIGFLIRARQNDKDFAFLFSPSCWFLISQFKTTS